ncbi:hypothetical protein Tco_1078004 [Tanacetum coccineum]
MVDSVILISYDSSEESVGSSTSQVILFGRIPNVIPADVSTTVHAVPEMAAAVVAPPVGVLDLDIHATSETDTFEDTSSPVHALAAPITSLFLCLDSSKSFGDFSDSDSPDSLSPPDSHETVIARWRIKRLRDPSSAYHHKVSVKVSTKIDIKDSIKTGAEGDIERDTKSYIDSDIMADIEANIAAEAATTIEADAPANAVAAVKGVGDDEAEDDAECSARGTVEIKVNVVTEPEVPNDILVPTIAESGARETFDIGLDVVIQQLYAHMLEFPVQRIANIEEEQRALEVRAITVDTKRNRMLERISVLEGSVMRLRETLTMERERTASVEHCLSYVMEELRRIRLTYQYNKMYFKRLETFAMRRLGYRLAKQNANRNPRPIIRSENQYGGGNGNHGNGNHNGRNGGVGGNAPVARVCTYKDFLNCQPRNFSGTGGVVGLLRWFEKMKYVYRISNCHVGSQMKFATCTLLDGALTWWNSHVQSVGINRAYEMSWKDLMKMVPEEEDKIERNAENKRKLENTLLNNRVE